MSNDDATSPDQDRDPVQATAASVDALALLSDLAALFASPVKLQLKIKEFETARAAAAKAMVQLAAERATHEEYLTSTRAELEQERKSLVQRQLKVAADEGRVRALEEVLRARQAAFDEKDIIRTDWRPAEGSTLTREPLRRSRRDGFPDHTTLTREPGAEITRTAPARIR